MKAAEEVTRFRVKADVQEAERRIQEEAKLRERLQNKADEAASSNRRDSSVLMKWNSLFQETVPQKLLEAINKQKESCSKIIESKDKLIADLKEELKNKDEEYVRALKEQATAIDDLISCMHERTKDMIERYAEELEAIENAFMNERKELLKSQQAEIDTMTERRRNIEDQNMKRRQEKVEDWQLRLHEIHETYGEYYNKLKCQLQTEIQGLEQQLEEMRALYQLNAEKLNYNLQVLSERVKENDKAIATHKRKLARLQDVLSGLITKYAETDKKFRHENNILTESYRRITEQYKDLQLKFQYFEKADTEKYRQVWNMNEEEAMKLVNQCLMADKVVFEQQLGVEWKPPDLNFWQEEDIEHGGEGEDDEVQEEHDDRELSEAALKMFELLKSECGFLVEDRIKKTISMLDEQDESKMDAQRLESIWKALGVNNKADIMKLLQHFVQPGSEDDTEAELINQQDCVKALTAYVEQQNKNACLASSKKHQQASYEERAKQRRRKEEKEFWVRMANVVPESHSRIWGALEDGLEKYYKQLQDRARLIDETDAIRQQNDELRALLNTYMQSKINEELFHPPQLTVANVPPQ
eukprot:TRINITY_DN42856_c0_g1_i1.p1 TRINITY_DN42856_c0_g1~~TRINITY_DN42856_c0_g1_i1.p1  ORF type:complete len:586 (+),score=275.75 TRINITY_DN42856_c0_g1_i1:76-1833(+)